MVVFLWKIWDAINYTYNPVLVYAAAILIAPAPAVYAVMNQAGRSGNRRFIVFSAAT